MTRRSKRILRPRATASAPPKQRTTPSSSGNEVALVTSNVPSTPAYSIQTLKVITLPAVSTPDIALLREKQAKLRTTAATATTASELPPHERNALFSTFIFAQYEAGTAVCIDPTGWILTCAHCYGDDEAEIRANMPGCRWLLSYTGMAVLTECRAWDARRDLALLEIIGVEATSNAAGMEASFAYVNLSNDGRMASVGVICIGQPGCDDLESKSARKTIFNLFEISDGRLRGLIPGVDPQDNSEIGALKHDAWTYWGHSGAPLLRNNDGTLVGLHSSWDDKTGMRHAIPLVAIREFVEERLPALRSAKAERKVQRTSPGAA